MSDELWMKGLDPLTGLPELHSFLEEAYRIAVRDLNDGSFPARASVCFNITNFRQYNNLHGLRGGDRCLRRVADILRDVFPDGRICRQSGDTFLVLARQDHVVDLVEEACEKINGYLANPGIFIKAGIRIIDEDVDVLKEQGVLFDQAMAACESVKKDRSHNWAYYTPAMGKYYTDRNYILEHFDSALTNGEIRVCFQPVVRSLTGKFCNSEALSRWEAPDYGVIRPDTFVQVLEEARLIHKLDLFVLKKVAEILRYEIDNGIPYVPISINFSRLDFILMDPFAEVEKVVREYGLTSDLICIEITETALLEDKTILSESIRKFRSAGHQVWLDDFGSGYSSLNVLQDFQLDEIKLDMGFLRNYSEKSRKVIKAIVIMAKMLGLQTLAEGVETRDQVEFLISIGCEKMQGYYYAKPMYLDTAVGYPAQVQMTVETQEEEKLLNAAGAINVITDTPVGFVLMDSRPQFLYANEACLSAIRENGFATLKDVNTFLLDSTNLHSQELLEIAQEACAEGKKSVVFTAGDQYMHILITRLSEIGNLTLFQIELQNLEP